MDDFSTTRIADKEVNLVIETVARMRERDGLYSACMYLESLMSRNSMYEWNDDLYTLRKNLLIEYNNLIAPRQTQTRP